MSCRPLTGNIGTSISSASSRICSSERIVMIAMFDPRFELWSTHVKQCPGCSTRWNFTGCACHFPSRPQLADALRILLVRNQIALAHKIVDGGRAVAPHLRHGDRAGAAVITSAASSGGGSCNSAHWVNYRPDSPMVSNRPGEPGLLTQPGSRCRHR